MMYDLWSSLWASNHHELQFCDCNGNKGELSVKKYVKLKIQLNSNSIIMINFSLQWETKFGKYRPFDTLVFQKLHPRTESLESKQLNVTTTIDKRDLEWDGFMFFS